MRPLHILLAATLLLSSLPAFAASDKNDTYAHKMEVGQLLFFNGDVDRAIRAFQRAAELNPKAVEPHMSLINLYAQKGGESGLANAEKECAEALRIKPGSKDVHLLYGTLLKNEAGSISDKEKMQAKCDDAMRELTAAMQAGASEPLCESQIALLYLQKGDFEEALKHINVAIEKQPVNADAHMVKAVLLFRGIGGDKVNAPEMKEKLQEVFAELDTAIKQKEKNPEAHNTKAQILVAANRLEDALSEYQATVKAEPKLQQAWLELANLLVTLAEKPETDGAKKKQLMEQARDAIDHAKKLKQDDRNIIYASGVIWEKHAALKDAAEDKVDCLRHALDEFTTGVQSETDPTLNQQIRMHIGQLQQALGIAPSPTSGLGGLGTFGMPQLVAPSNGSSNVFTREGLGQDFSNMIKLDAANGGTK